MMTNERQKKVFEKDGKSRLIRTNGKVLAVSDFCTLSVFGADTLDPRYISYRCISGRDRNGIVCSLANKYYSGTKIEGEVREVISSMVTIPEFVELVAKKINVQTDAGELKKKQNSVRAEITKYNGNLMQTEKRMAELDINDKHYDQKVGSMNRILDDFKFNRHCLLN